VLRVRGERHWHPGVVSGTIRLLGIRLGDGIAMRATPLLLGCLLGLGVIAAATAHGSSSVGTLGSGSSSGYNCNNQSSERSNGHDETQASTGDALAVSRSGHTAPAASTNHRANTPSDGDVTHFGDDASPNHSSHGSGLSWQSLLPGSIQ
jgi:hypothetical protein